MCKKNLLILYTSLIDGWVGLAHYNKAWEIFDSIRTWKNVQPDEVLFTVMIK